MSNYWNNTKTEPSTEQMFLRREEQVPKPKPKFEDEIQTGLKLRSGVIWKCKTNIRIINTFLLSSDNPYLTYIPHFTICGKKMITEI